MGVPARGRSAWWPRRSGCRPCLRHSVGVLGQRPVSGASDQCPRVPIQTTGVQCPVRASERPGVRCPVSGVRAFPRPLCPAEVRSCSAAVGQAAARLGWPGSAWSPAASTTGSWSARVGAWRSKLARPCWASGGIGLDLAVVVEGGWAVARPTAWPTRIGGMRGGGSPVGRGNVCSEVRLLWQACAARHTPGLAAQSPGSVPVREASNGPQR